MCGVLAWSCLRTLLAAHREAPLWNDPFTTCSARSRARPWSARRCPWQPLRRRFSLKKPPSSKRKPTPRAATQTRPKTATTQIRQQIPQRTAPQHPPTPAQSTRKSLTAPPPHPAAPPPQPPPHPSEPAPTPRPRPSPPRHKPATPTPPRQPKTASPSPSRGTTPPRAPRRPST